jgi:hypothetical protein
MAYYGLLITTFIWPAWGEHLVFSIVEYILGTILGMSIIDKFLYFWGPKSPSPVDNQSPMNPQSLNGPEIAQKRISPPLQTNNTCRPETRGAVLARVPGQARLKIPSPPKPTI